MESKIINKSLKYMFKRDKLELNNSYIGIFDINNFQSLKIHLYKNCSLICFLNTISDVRGHWVSIFKINNKLYFIDSYGYSPIVYYNLHIKNNYMKFTNYLSIKYQSDLSTSCGAYCIFFIYIFILCNYNIKRIEKITNFFFHQIEGVTIKNLLNL